MISSRVSIRVNPVLVVHLRVMSCYFRLGTMSDNESNEMEIDPSPLELERLSQALTDLDEAIRRRLQEIGWDDEAGYFQEHFNDLRAPYR